MKNLVSRSNLLAKETIYMIELWANPTGEEWDKFSALGPLHELASVLPHPDRQHLVRNILHCCCSFCLLLYLQVSDEHHFYGDADVVTTKKFKSQGWAHFFIGQGEAFFYRPGWGIFFYWPGWDIFFIGQGETFFLSARVTHFFIGQGEAFFYRPGWGMIKTSVWVQLWAKLSFSGAENGIWWGWSIDHDNWDEDD